MKRWKLLSWSILTVALIALGAWLAHSRRFVDITALPVEQAMAAQAAWFQAFLSVAAVLTAVGVAWKQSNESRRLADLAHLRTIDLFERDVRQKVRREISLRKSRQLLALDVLRPLNKALLKMVRATERCNVADSKKAADDVERIAKLVEPMIVGVRGYLVVDARSALAMMKILEGLNSAATSKTSVWHSKAGEYNAIHQQHVVTDVSHRAFAYANAGYIRLLKGIVMQVKRL